MKLAFAALSLVLLAYGAFSFLRKRVVSIRIVDEDELRKAGL